MSELVRGHAGLRVVGGDTGADEPWDIASGRHAFDEDAALTPIFHALARGGWRSRTQGPAPDAAPDPVAEFQRDPLTAPIPRQTLTAVPSHEPRRTTGAHAMPEPRRGRHHRRFLPVKG